MKTFFYTHHGCGHGPDIPKLTPEMVVPVQPSLYQPARTVGDLADAPTDPFMPVRRFHLKGFDELSATYEEDGAARVNPQTLVVEECPCVTCEQGWTKPNDRFARWSPGQ